MPTQTASVAISKETLTRAWELMCTARAMADLYEENREVFSKYVHATSKGHEAIQLACGLQLKPYDWVSPYYRDECMLLSFGYTPYDLMLQIFAKQDDPFSGGRTYYGHASSRREDMPKIPHQSSATGMQAIPATGIAQGLRYLEKQGLCSYQGQEPPVVICSIGDAALTEGEVAEAFHFAVLKTLPILYLVQDNEWDISAHAREVRAMDAVEFAKGFKGLQAYRINGSDFIACYELLHSVINKIRLERRPFLIQAKVPLLNHHTSGVRKEWYRPKADLEEHASRDPFPLFRKQLLAFGFREDELLQMQQRVKEQVVADYKRAYSAPDPSPADLTKYIFAETPIKEEQGTRSPAGAEKVVMVDAALHAVDEILKKHPEAVLYGQDVGGELGGVFREAALLAKKYGTERVFNTPITEAYIIGSTLGMSLVGCKPIVEIQFADYIWPGLNQLFTELSRSYYLSNGKWPVQSLIRVPTGAYGCGGPYHSSSVESVVLQIKGVKVVYPSNAADMKGLMKGAFYDPNPVVIFEHKGLYWSKVPGTQDAKTIEPDEDYIIPLGKAAIALEADAGEIHKGQTLTVITYGMGVHWAKNAARQFPGRIEVVDLRTLNPLDEDMVFSSVKKHGKCIVITEETVTHSFAEALAGRIASACFEFLDAPVKIIGAVNTPAIPINATLENAMLPSADKVAAVMKELLAY
ncbi:MAG: oxoisovalerate dehydrogenase subunits alpha/beta [Chitinophagales bacterium]|nr:MAG: oxoisovalerate dehydrogenase subunits alpha/beta [Chitinophagales bacterium]